MKKELIVNLAIIAFSAGAQARDLPVPHGRDVLSLASNCSMGEFGQIGKAGQYNSYCDDLTDAEKCLALVKRYMRNTGELQFLQSDAQRAEFCIEEFQNALSGE